MPIATVNVKLLLCLALVSWLPAAPAFAAPASSEELSGSAEPRTSGAGSPGVSAAGVPVVPSVTQSKTVELLLQMQDQPQALGTEERGGSSQARRASSTASAAAVATAKAPEAADATPLAALKNAILRDAAPRAAEATRTTAAGPGPAGFEGQSPSGQVSSAAVVRREPGQGLLSNPVIQYIRENRTLIVSISLGVLAAIWLTANFSLRRGR